MRAYGIVVLSFFSSGISVILIFKCGIVFILFCGMRFSILLAHGIR